MLSLSNLVATAMLVLGAAGLRQPMTMHRRCVSSLRMSTAMSSSPSLPPGLDVAAMERVATMAVKEAGKVHLAPLSIAIRPSYLICSVTPY